MSEHDKDIDSTDPLNLSLEDTAAMKIRGVGAGARTGATGYNPYDAVPAAKGGQDPRKPTDLRKLSEWIRLQRQVQALKKDEPEKP